MSKFQVGDRVIWDGERGTVTRVNGAYTEVEYDNGSLGSHNGGSLSLAPPVAVAPMAIGEVLGVTGGYKPQWQFTFGPEFKRLQDAMARVFAPAPPVPPLEMAGENMAMRAALDKVRVFFASHRFDSLGVAAGREMREVMAVVLAALDADKAAK